ncbi:MAG: hypothetical protein ACRDGM_02810 [bacterium]
MKVKMKGRMTAAKKGWGFALIEISMVAILRKGEKVDRYRWGESLAEERAGVLRGLKQLGDAGNIGPITTPVNPGGIPWPANTFITRVTPITRLYGLSGTRVFHVLVELKAPGRRELIKAFEYLDHFCAVEGYGGGG